ncbi:MAG: type II CAAX prenyl endopeptidase Rce1 family protein [Planctomycetota bacterium]
MRRARKKPVRPDVIGGGRVRGIAAGYLAMLPLLLFYEAAAGGPDRSVAEVVATLPLTPLGSAAASVRLALLLVLAVLAGWRVFRESREDGHPGLLPIVGRIVLEGALAALCLGPLLLALLWALDVDLASIRIGLSNAASWTPLERAGYLAGAAAWEEIVFRIGVQSLLWLLAAECLRALAVNRSVVVPLAEGLSIGGAAALFAASHLAAFVAVLGPGGEPFDPAVFTWRCLAGILFGALFRWRGPGVAAWTHALFDLALSIGAGPDVFL